MKLSQLQKKKIETSNIKSLKQKLKNQREEKGENMARGNLALKKI